jgi:hypothetical protein
MKKSGLRGIIWGQVRGAEKATCARCASRYANGLAKTQERTDFLANSLWAKREHRLPRLSAAARRATGATFGAVLV